MKQYNNIKKRRIFYILLITSLMLGGIIYFVLQHSSKQIIESHALIVAEIVAQNATASRSVYTSEIVRKLQADGFGTHIDFDNHKGFVPIPAQFLKLIGKASTEKSHELFSYKPVSKWNLEPTQGLSDDFLKWAWEKLESQDQEFPSEPINWKPVWRIEESNGSLVLRFLYPDAASNQACVDCHNAYEKLPEIIHRRKEQKVDIGKNWKINQLLGALSITVPLNQVKKVAKEQLQRTTTLLTITIALTLVLLAWFTRKNVRQEMKIQELDWKSSHDQLTGLLNRHGWEAVCEGRECRQHKQQNILVCFIDLDHFKPINDKYGHKVGDSVLQSVSEVLRKATRINDILIRLGGDEFVAIYFDCNLSQAEERGNRLLEEIHSVKIKAGGDVLSITASIGITHVTAEEKDLNQSLERADKASYEAKKRGRNQVFIN